MPWMMAAAVVGSSLLGSRTAKKAGETQAAAADRAAELQKEQFERQVELQAPFREAGVRALPELEAASRYTPFGMDQFQQDPGYGFRLAEGQKTLDRQAAARGGLISGSALKAAQRYGQEMGSQEYTNAFNRYQIERNARLNPLQSLAGFGQTSVNQLGQAGQNYASNVGNLMTGGAAAQAAGQVGAANALTGGLGTYLNYTQNNALLEALKNRRSTYGGGGGYSGSGQVNPVSGDYMGSLEF
jgi:hypothetical protein